MGLGSALKWRLVVVLATTAVPPALATSAIPLAAGAQTSAGATGGRYAAPAGQELADGSMRALTVAAGYVAPPAALADDGEIVASATEGDIEERSLSVFDVIHVEPAFDGRSASIGDSLLVYRDGGELQHPITHGSLGRIVHPTGIAVVTALEAGVVSAVIREGFSPVITGQRVQYLRSRQAALPAGQRSLGEGVVVGLREPAAIVEPYAIIYLDVPAGSGLRAGADVRLIRRVSEEGRRLPEIAIGTARVLDVAATAATALVVHLSRSDLEVGDRYAPLAPES